MQAAVLPPSHPDSERSVLGAMLQDPEAVLLAQELLSPAAFYQPAHRELFDAMVSLRRQPVDLVTVDEVFSAGARSRRGARSIWCSSTCPPANVRAYIDIVDEKFTLRS